MPPSWPAGYNENVLVLLVQGPGVVFAYLELSDHFWGALLRQGQPVVRLYDTTDAGVPPAQPVREVALPPYTADWYFRGLVAGRTYVAELGWRDPEGVFVSLLRSNPAATPAQRGEGGGARRKTVVAFPPAVPVWRRESEEEGPPEDLPSSYS